MKQPLSVFGLRLSYAFSIEGGLGGGGGGSLSDLPGPSAPASSAGHSISYFVAPFTALGTQRETDWKVRSPFHHPA